MGEYLSFPMGSSLGRSGGVVPPEQMSIINSSNVGPVAGGAHLERFCYGVEKRNG